MNQDKNKPLKLGVLVTTGVLLFVILVYMIGSRGNLFSSTNTFYANFKDIKGVVKGNNIRLAGINIGTVKSIEMNVNNEVVLELSIREKYGQHIYKDAIVELGQDGLMGNKLVYINAGTASKGIAIDGDTLNVKNGIDMTEIITKVANVVDNMGATVGSLQSITAKIDSGKGDIGKLLNEATLVPNLNNSLSLLNGTLADVQNITRKVNSGEGDLAKLINSDEITTETTQILTKLQTTTQTAETMINELENTASALNNGGGIAAKLINDEALAKQVDTTVVNVNDALLQLSSAAKAIEESWIVRLFSKKKKEK